MGFYKTLSDRKKNERFYYLKDLDYYFYNNKFIFAMLHIIDTLYTLSLKEYLKKKTHLNLKVSMK